MKCQQFSAHFALKGNGKILEVLSNIFEVLLDAIDDVAGWATDVLKNGSVTRKPFQWSASSFWCVLH